LPHSSSHFLIFESNSSISRAVTGK
jgi:hypothetical protein